MEEILHIPFARTNGGKEGWKGDWFGRNIKLNKAKYFNAQNKEDILKVKNPLVLISGGRQSANLLRQLRKDYLLLDLIKNAKYIVAESAGAKVLAEHTRLGDNDGVLVNGLGIIKDTVIEPHYLEKDRQKLLELEMEETGAKYGLGIDSMSGIEFDLNEFPQKYNKLGNGLFEIIDNSIKNEG